MRTDVLTETMELVPTGTIPTDPQPPPAQLLCHPGTRITHRVNPLGDHTSWLTQDRPGLNVLISCNLNTVPFILKRVPVWRIKYKFP